MIWFEFYPRISNLISEFVFWISRIDSVMEECINSLHRMNIIIIPLHQPSSLECNHIGWIYLRIGRCAEYLRVAKAIHGAIVPVVIAACRKELAVRIPKACHAQLDKTQHHFVASIVCLA